MAPTVDHPTLQKTRLGWVLAGRWGAAPRGAQKLRAFHTSVECSELHERVNKFWDLEELAGPAAYTLEERACETHFLKHVSAHVHGRYVVKLPVREDVLSRVGDSREIAAARLRGIEKRFRREPNLMAKYTQFLDEYLALGHMRRVRANEVEKEGAVYLPHHGVFKGGDRDKLRVVFDASCGTTTGVSLNNVLMTGPTIQQDLVSILSRFRTFAVAFTADVIKMYRQIWVHESQTHLQRILWRRELHSPVEDYELLTVTYGTSSAPFLATRCIRHLAETHASEYPAGSVRVLRDFYVDDLLTGADTLNEAERIRDEVGLLGRGHFELSKWSSNCRDLVRERVTADDAVFFDKESRVLGVIWNPSDDVFRFKYECAASTERTTKRTMLSEIARLFDPLGLLGPVTVAAKIILQDTWQIQIGWDESLPQDIHTRWIDIKRQLPYLDELQVPRWVGTGNSARGVQLHGFCDASERAYGACIYVRTESHNGEYRAGLLISKSRVAPVRAISVPRLELSAALLLARLVDKVRGAMDLSGMEMHLWTDSTITLQWISSSSRRWAVFVANRVGEIQRLTDRSRWRHVPSANNPADVLSRGLGIPELARSCVWWSGPAFLRRAEDCWPARKNIEVPADMPEQKGTIVAVVSVEKSIVQGLLERCSNLNKITRIVAYCLRFCRSHGAGRSESFVSHEETSRALRVVVRAVQRESFPEEYRLLSEERGVGGSSRILSLAPFLDREGVIRVGGRLGRAELPYESRHPALLPGNHALTKLIVRSEHVGALHAGVQATLQAVRRRFWPINARSVICGIIHGCVRCFKSRPVCSEALMADLPKNRVTASRPFAHTGVDYAGPMLLKESKRRNARKNKAYMAIFVCFATKAVHIELVTDLTSEAFLGALKRFISRRGAPLRMYSDNGTTFVGANKMLKEFREVVVAETTQRAIREFLTPLEASWSFVPPHAPHFGGLWEAAVKAAKSHLNRIVGDASLTFEEAQTVLSEIEAILNSRPLTPLSADPSDLSCITPGHFLIGAALNSFPVPDASEKPINLRLRWQRVEQMRQHFWRRWSSEYLHTLIQRTKWKRNKGEQLRVGQMVLIQQPGLGPLQWLLGRVRETHPGSDGNVRTATLDTAKGQLTRPLTKLAILPLEDDGSPQSERPATA